MRRFLLLALILTLTATPAFARRGVFRQRTVIRGGGFGGGAVVVPGQSFGQSFAPVGGYGCGNNGVGASFIPQQQIQYVPVQSRAPVQYVPVQSFAPVGGGCNNEGAAFAPVATPYQNVGVGFAPVGGIGGARVFRQRTVVRGW